MVSRTFRRSLVEGHHDFVRRPRAVAMAGDKFRRLFTVLAIHGPPDKGIEFLLRQAERITGD